MSLPRYDIICALERKGWNLDVLHHPRLRSDSSVNSITETAETGAYLPGVLRRAILNVGLALRATQFSDLVDLHMRRQVEQFLRLLVRNDYLAPLLLLLRGTSVALIHTVSWLFFRYQMLSILGDWLT
ncbi:unnamed protein product [Hydatigera taeniaeformis]|uniref:Uncharacterized protein n=1 Tax=Hydatigena taeniaeformis TaxID=6205 RepID=A0A3P7GY55_HYDTA|nr:unnamed protein product [Hydatigera taeniaeformis]